MSRFFFAAIVAALIAIAVWSLRSRETPAVRSPAKSETARTGGAAAANSAAPNTPGDSAPGESPVKAMSPGATAAVSPPTSTEEGNTATEVPAEAPIVLAEPLNAPRGTVGADLDTLRIVLEAWRSNFPHEGNPVGENVEITAALTGKNPLRIALIPKNHPAINAEGQLCDRWGTPFHFHQISGDRMELRSAGPDRQFGTTDDALLAPPQAERAVER